MAVINNVAYSWTMITLSSVALGINAESSLFSGVTSIKWSKKRNVKTNYGLSGKATSRGMGNLVCAASIKMDYATQETLRSTYGSLMDIGDFDLTISFANKVGDETADWKTRNVTLKGCFFSEDGMDSQNDDTNIEKEFELNPFDISID